MKYKIFLFLLISSSLFPQNDLRAELSLSMKEIMPKVIEWRHDIHEFPELSNREFRTSKIVADHLERLGIEIETGMHIQEL